MTSKGIIRSGWQDLTGLQDENNYKGGIMNDKSGKCMSFLAGPGIFNIN